MITLPFAPTAEHVAIVTAGYAVLLATSGFVVTTALGLVEGEMPTDRERDVGVLVGKCENVLTLTFVLAGAFTALAALFARRSFMPRPSDRSAARSPSCSPRRASSGRTTSRRTPCSTSRERSST